MSSQLRLSLYGALATMAATLSLTSVFSTSGWVLPVFGAIILVIGTCALVRMSPLPSAIEPIAAAIVVLLMLTAIDAHAKAHLGFIPGRLAFRHLGDVARNGFNEIHNKPTPAPAHHGLVMLTVIGVAAIALLVDLVSVTLRRAALAGLPLLGLFTVCAATGHHGVGVIEFIVAAIGYLWLLYADNRDKVARWGAAMGTGNRARPASAWSTDAASAPAPASLGRQVGAVAISLGVIVPVFIPGLHTGINQHSTGTGTGDGGGGSTHTYDPIVKIGADLQQSIPAPVMTYTTSAGNPGYIRLTSLDQFNGLRFTSKQLTAPANQSANETLPVTAPKGQTVTTSYAVSQTFVAQWLPSQSTVLGVSVGEPWRFDPASSTVFAATASTAGLRYSTRSIANQPTSAELAAAPKPTSELDDLTLPMALINPRVKALEKRITAKSPTRYDAALAIQRYLTNPRFTYDATIPADNSSDALADFLFNTRRGFCQQFSTAMAVMARMDGIPSRIAVGFTRGKLESDGKTWQVTTHDAHAWPELWFQGYGWLAFEPTPRGDGQAVAPSYATPGSGSHIKGGNGDLKPPKPGSKGGLPSNQHPAPAPGSNTNTLPGARAATTWSAAASPRT